MSKIEKVIEKIMFALVIMLVGVYGVVVVVYFISVVAFMVSKL